MYEEEEWDGCDLNRSGIVSKMDIKGSNRRKFGVCMNGWSEGSKKKENGGSGFYRGSEDWIGRDGIEYVRKDGEILDNGS